MSRDPNEMIALADLLDVAEVWARPHPYATSCSVEELSVTRADGTSAMMVLKDFSRERMLDDARRSRPAFLDDPAREIETYLHVLAPNGIGPHVHASVVDPFRSRWWLVCEHVRGLELWQVGDLAVWEEVAEWLGSMHRRFVGRSNDVVDASPRLFRFDRAWFLLWAARARATLHNCADDRAGALVGALEGYERHVEFLASAPVTFVHGELYPSNVIVDLDQAPTRVCPVDWEMAGVGPAMLDLAALTVGWDATASARLLAAYGPVDHNSLATCRLHLALQWIGWSATWRPPAHHARDWVGEALAHVQELA